MATYVVGDIQGCFHSLQALLKAINFSSDRDRLWLVGDLVNRGPMSLKTLQLIISMQDNVQVVLGNHDLYLLALYYRAWPAKPDHTLNNILNHPQANSMIEWLRQQPLAYFDAELKCAMIHAGLFPKWSLTKALELAEEVSQRLKSDSCTQLLEYMYGNNPNHWQEDLQDPGRTRFIVNALTRMRYVTAEGRLDLHHKEAPLHSPSNLHPWYEHPELQIPEGVTLCFGHWASLGGKCQRSQVVAVDTGCVWGDALSAYCIETGKLTSVAKQEQTRAN